MECEKKIKISSEKIFFALIILSVFIISVLMKDSAIVTSAAICGISYTLAAGKGKLYCFFVGMAGTLCYAYLAFKNTLYANCALYALYYFPMEITGIFKWKRHIDVEKREIIKTKQSLKLNIISVSAATFVSVVSALFMKYTNNASPFLDSFATVFSIYGMYLTVKRCIEQWDVWLFVNILSLIAWIKAYLNGSEAFGIMLMWLIYIFLSLYFKYQWSKEIKTKSDCLVYSARKLC